MVSIPPKLGPFEPLHRLGAGGMAETFVAVRRGPAGFEQRVCIKRILPAYESDQDFVASFLDEARTSAGLRHANIVQVVDFGVSEPDGSHYLALELVDGLDLRALLQRVGRLDPELATLIASDLAAALAHAHSADEGRPSVIHRDLSPSNVLVSRAGEVKLTDFGIARVIGGAHRTATGVIKGKVPYMPPEYIDGGRFDARGDLFSLGVMLYELCHGRRPFDGDSELDTMRRIASGERRAFEVPAPPAFIACVERLLVRDPDARFADAVALLDALPPTHVHQARTRLAQLVRGRPSVPASQPPPVGATPPTPGRAPRVEPTDVLGPAPVQVGLLPTEPRPSFPTQTAVPSGARRTRRPALYVLAASVLVLLVVVGAVLLRSTLQQASAAPVPRLPESPSAAAPADTLAARFGAKPRARSEQVVEAAEPADEVVEDVAVPEAVAEPSKPGPALNEAEPDEAHHARRARKGQSAELRVVVYPFGDVWVDDKHAGESPISLHLSPGTHEIAVGEGRARERRTVHLRAGENESLTFRPPRTSTN